MTTKEVKKLLKEENLEWIDFMRWMFGQTYGIDEKGNTDWYEVDVERFIKYRGGVCALD